MLVEVLWSIVGKLRGYIQYSLVGSVGFVVHLGVLWLLTDYLHLWYMVSAVIAIIVAALNNYVLNYLWTFRDRKANINNKVLGYFQYLLSRGFTEGLYLALLYVMTDIVGFHYLMSAVLVQVVTAFIGYVIALKWIWRYRGAKNKTRRKEIDLGVDVA